MPLRASSCCCCLHLPDMSSSRASAARSRICSLLRERASEISSLIPFTSSSCHLSSQCRSVSWPASTWLSTQRKASSQSSSEFVSRRCRPCRPSSSVCSAISYSSLRRISSGTCSQVLWLSRSFPSLSLQRQLRTHSAPCLTATRRAASEWVRHSDRRSQPFFFRQLHRESSQVSSLQRAVASVKLLLFCTQPV